MYLVYDFHNKYIGLYLTDCMRVGSLQSLDLEQSAMACEHLTSCYKHFKTLLKTYMFNYRPRSFVTFYISALEILLLTYLLTYLKLLGVNFGS